ncbi:hypothetical protein PybrP1_011715 [[Pythium] brassicae (nom. inval.)]|nr:hypothetical protein PybrP1_011715 [[Pythium] brassicae (nom. inval.)]
MEEHMEEMRVSQTIAFFNRTVELCFSDCVHSFRSKKMDDTELSCVNNCAEKFLRYTMRSSTRDHDRAQENEMRESESMKRAALESSEHTLKNFSAAYVER